MLVHSLPGKNSRQSINVKKSDGSASASDRDRKVNTAINIANAPKYRKINTDINVASVSWYRKVNSTITNLILQN